MRRSALRAFSFRALHQLRLPGATAAAAAQAPPQDLAPDVPGEAKRVAATTIPTSWGALRTVAFHSAIGDILAVVSGIGDGRRVPVRVHDACLTGEAFGSLKCDCGLQLQMALAEHRKHQLGVIIYMPQEGRGIGLANKIAAYYLQEEHGLDTVDANLALGLPAEMRDYSAVRVVLKDLGIKSILLMTNNPFKVERLRASGVSVDGTMPLVAAPTDKATSSYLETKRQRMGHRLPEVPLGWRPPPAALAGPAAALLSELRGEIATHSGERPFTLLSFATSMDGFIAGLRAPRPGMAGEDGSGVAFPVSLSGEASSALTHHLRGSVDAILVGLGTVRTDDPRLDVRSEGAGPSPRPVVLDSQLRLPLDSRLLSHRAEGGRPPTLILCTDEEKDSPGGSHDNARAERAKSLEAAGAVVLRCQADPQGRVCLRDAWRRLWEVGVRSIMVEGGAKVIAALLTEDSRPGLVDRLVVTQAGVILGSGVSWAAAGAVRLRKARNFGLGADTIFTSRLDKDGDAAPE